MKNIVTFHPNESTHSLSNISQIFVNWWRYSQYNICWLRYPGQRGVKFPPVPRSWHSVPDKLSGHSVPDDLSLTLCPGHAVLDKLSGHAVADRFCVDTRVSRKYMDDDSDQSRLTIGRRPGCIDWIYWWYILHMCAPYHGWIPTTWWATPITTSHSLLSNLNIRCTI